MVTCQTLLIHVKYPEQVIKEMHRVLKPGGICEKGKINLGKGDNSLGDLLPGILNELGLIEIKTYMSDKAFSFIPPYVSSTEKSLLEQAEDWRKREFWIWDKEETKSYFLAGNGNSDEFDFFWKKAMESQNQLNELVLSNKSE